MASIKKNNGFNLLLNAFMLLIISSITFFSPLYLFDNKSSINNSYELQTAIIFIILIINEAVFVLQSETVKIYCGKKMEAKKIKTMYKLLFETQYGPRNLSMLIFLFTLVVICVQWFVFKNIASISCSISIFLIYFISIHCFALIASSQDLYRKRDFLFFRPFPIISTPLCVAVFWSHGSYGDFKNSFLLVINILVVLLYYVMLKKNKFLKKGHFAAIVIATFVSYVSAYIFLSTEAQGILFENMDIFLFSCCYSLYICLLYSLMYARLYPVRTPRFNESIEKFQTYMFAFFPLVAFPLFIFLTDATIHLYVFAFINLCAFFIIGIKFDEKNIINTIVSIPLIILFFIVAFLTLKIRNASIFNVELNFNGELILTIIIDILGIIFTIASAKKFESKEDCLEVFKKPKYIVSIGSSVTLFLLAVIYQKSTEYENQMVYPMYCYCIFNFIFTAITFYFDYDKEKNK